MSVGIIGAMDQEVSAVLAYMSDVQQIKLFDTTFYEGKINNKSVVLVKSGIGKVKAAISATLLISNFKVKAVINTGSAGAIADILEVSDVVIANKVAYHDVNLLAFDYKLGQLPGYEPYFICDQSLVQKAYQASEKIKNIHVYKGTILTGDTFVADKNTVKELAKNFDNPFVCEMEGAAIAQVCHDFNTPFVIIRSASDKADGNADVSFNDFIQIASANSALIVQQLISNL